MLDRKFPPAWRVLEYHVAHEYLRTIMDGNMVPWLNGSEGSGCGVGFWCGVQRVWLRFGVISERFSAQACSLALCLLGRQAIGPMLGHGFVLGREFMRHPEFQCVVPQSLVKNDWYIHGRDPGSGFWVPAAMSSANDKNSCVHCACAQLLVFGDARVRTSAMACKQTSWLMAAACGTSNTWRGAQTGFGNYVRTWFYVLWVLGSRSHGFCLALLLRWRLEAPPTSDHSRDNVNLLRGLLQRHEPWSCNMLKGEARECWPLWESAYIQKSSAWAVISSVGLGVLGCSLASRP